MSPTLKQIVQSKYNNMEILINDSKTINEVQRDFSREFPFLKLEFFDAPYQQNKALPKSKMFSHDRKIGTIRKVHQDGKLVLDKNEKVSELETELWKNFGLTAQVFRRSGNLWIETSLTDSWTLEQQNREGFELANDTISPYQKAEEEDITDRDKWD